MEIEKYVVLSSKDASLGEASEVYDSLDDAREAAQPGNAIIALKFEMTDSELVEVIPAESEA